MALIARLKIRSITMNFFYYLFFNQYAEIKGRKGDVSKAQLNTILLSTALLTVYIVIIFVIYGEMNRGFFEKYFKIGSLSGRTVGKLFAVIAGAIVFFLLKAAIGTKKWFNAAVASFEGMSPEMQKATAKKGAQYFLFASIPVILLIGWAIISAL
jgi:hypothetical protein